ncbi:type III-A CRISPR-associated protein Csm2 [Peptoniphilus indolicus]|uniref:CRISPR system Cms protein Csm2 n=2 Tax=Peptoniphilus indolicus TaxID=33030 RepID=G4D1Z0_9FIRM|nr:type III-A CRISPR-associated protein Csm2 [Peptoniphilus indolicus]EGY80421.1 csm2 family CRISPR-associated protein [Peptoniphilus indolicus ATCC 29427]SUB75495.1 CRISPR type III-A/MTUBE-associated protein Csm2 [Peptoniphilus indolicus]
MISKLGYVDEAEKIIKNLSERKLLNTNQIRKILSKVSVIYEKAKRKTGNLTEQEKMDLQVLRAHLIYDSGRDEGVRRFVSEAKLVENIKEIGDSREKLLIFCGYMEALVAYHKYYLANKSN